MHILKKRWSALLLALALALSLASPVLAAEAGRLPAGTAPADTAREAAAAAMTYGNAVSLQYAVWQEGEITLSGHVGNYSRTENRALTGDELYGIGSVSKIYTTAAVLQLAEQGKIRLDAPVTRYLPDFKMADPRYRDITVRMLLNHSSGIMGSSLQNAMLFDDTNTAATDTLLKTLSTQRLKAAPGAYSVYCNDGFTLAELVVESVSGQSFPEYIRAHILAPLKLEDTFAPGDSFDPSRLSKIYQGGDTRALPQDCLNAVGAGGLYATAADLAAFGGAFTGTSLLRRTSLDAMASPEYLRGIWPGDDLDLLSYGLGWDAVHWYPFCQSGITALVKGGDTLYYHAGLLVLPEYGLSVAVVSSGGASTYNELAATQIALAVLTENGIAVDQSIPASPDAQPSAIPDELLEQAGYYAATSAQYRVDITADGIMTIHYLNYPASIPPQSFQYCSDGFFRDGSGMARMTLVKETNGETYLYQKAFSSLPGLGVLPISNYAAVKVPENFPSQEVQAVWNRAALQDFVPVGERYSSQVYLALGAAAAAETPEQIPGYVGPARIADASTLRYELQLPGAGGRDGQDLRLYTQDGAVWMDAAGSIYLSSEDIPVLFTGTGWSYTTIQTDGFARWYQVGEGAGKVMTVQAPENSGFWVYDGNWQVTASSVLWDDASATLPEGGFVVFAGDTGSRFHLSFR